MKVSYNWLKKYIKLEGDIERIAEILTEIGLEVEGVEKVESIKGGLQGIVVGHVVECVKHPNADKLSLTKVDVGQEELLQIVCGAPNVAQNKKVLVATVGTSLYPAEGDPWKIKKGKIRGELSEGMICAEDELGLGDDHSGIIVLPDDVAVGTSAREVYNIEDDYIFEIGLTPNRSDATCHMGVAQDIAAYFKVHSDEHNTVKDFVNFEFDVDENGSGINVTVENRTACPRYSGVLLSELKIGPSPDWMRNLLQSIGVRPINNVVDITNFVLHAYGQPLHAFDASKIGGNEIRVKNLAEGTKFISLDEKERTLTSEDLMICDGDDRPMCIAGIFGGLNSGVTDGTTSIFLESAHFAASETRKSSTHHLLRTDAAKIFEKGSDPNNTVKALKKAIGLLKEYAGAKVSSEIIDIYPTPIEEKEILLSFDNVNRLIGSSMSNEDIVGILHAMGMTTKVVDDTQVYVQVPTNKADVLREVDLIEEVLRIYGFNKVEIPTVLKTTIHTHNHPNARSVKNTVSELLAGNGFNEMMGLSLAESKWYEDHNELVFINNTSNTHLDIMRPDVLLSGLDSVSRNINHQQTDLRLFEFGKSYQKAEAFVETPHLSLFITGKESALSWISNGQRDAGFYDIKKWVSLVLNRLNIASFQNSELEEDPHFEYGLHYHRGPKTLVKFGLVDSSVLKQFDIKQEVYYADFNWQNILDFAISSNVRIEPISKYPSTSRDLALVVDEHVKFGDIIRLTGKTEKKLITDIELFDVYTNNEQLGEGKKSYAVKFVFQNLEKTLKDKDVDKVINKLTEVFGKELGAVIRK